MVVQAGQDGTELDLSSLSLETVEDMCNEAADGCPTEPGVIHMPNLTALVDRIPLDNQWWVPPTRTHIILFSCKSAMTQVLFNIAMAPPPVPASANSSTSTGVRTSSRSRGAVKYVDTSDDDIKMDDRDNERTPRRTRSASRKRGVISPRLQGPPAQRARIDDSVRHTYFITVSELTIPCRTLVGHVKTSTKSACLFLVGLQRWPAKTVRFQGSLAGLWRSGLMNLSLRLSLPREKRHPRKRRLPSKQRERGKNGTMPVRVRNFYLYPHLLFLQQSSMISPRRWTRSGSSSQAVWRISTPGRKARFQTSRPRLNARCRNLVPSIRRQSLSLVGSLLNFKALQQSICFCFSHFASRPRSASHLPDFVFLRLL